MIWGGADATVVYEDRGISGGMHYGIERAKKLGRPVEHRYIFETLRSNVIVLSGPTGAGKTKLARVLLQQIAHMRVIVSTTTREKRPSDFEYEYVSYEEFAQRMLNKEFLWDIDVRGFFYGTKRSYVEQIIAQRETGLALLTIEAAGMLKSFYPTRVVCCYVTAPEDIRFERLVKRGDNLESIRKGLEHSRAWDKTAPMLTADDGEQVFRTAIINDGRLSTAVRKLFNALLYSSKDI